MNFLYSLTYVLLVSFENCWLSDKLKISKKTEQFCGYVYVHSRARVVITLRLLELLFR